MSKIDLDALMYLVSISIVVLSISIVLILDNVLGDVNIPEACFVLFTVSVLFFMSTSLGLIANNSPARNPVSN